MLFGRQAGGLQSPLDRAEASVAEADLNMPSTQCDGGFALAASDPSFSGRKVLPDLAESNESRDRVLQLGRRRVFPA